MRRAEAETRQAVIGVEVGRREVSVGFRVNPLRGADMIHCNLRTDRKPINSELIEAREDRPNIEAMFCGSYDRTRFQLRSAFISPRGLAPCWVWILSQL